MTKKKLAVPLLAIATLAGAAAGFAGMVSAQTAVVPTTTTVTSVQTSTVTPSTTSGTSVELPESQSQLENQQGETGSHTDGNVTAINGTTFTLTEESNEGGAVYTVNAGAATVTKNGATSALSAIAVGDKVSVEGAISGNTITATTVSAGQPQGGGHGDRGGMGGPHIDGNVTAVNGTTITLTEESNESNTVYTVDASKATITKNGAASALSNVAVGDKLFVQGTATGSSVTATSIMDGKPSGR